MSTVNRYPWMGLLAFLLPLVIYLWLPASTVNGDGMSYYDCVREGAWKTKFLPGHILYCPLMTLVGGVAEGLRPSSVLRTMLLANQLAGAFAASLLFRTAKQLGLNQFGQWLAALGFAFSYGLWVQATDIEAYALGVLLVVASVHRMARYAERHGGAHLVALGVLNGAAALSHLTLLALAPTSVWLIVSQEKHAPRRVAGALSMYVAGMILCFVLPVLAVGFWILELPTVGAFLAWMTSSGHGYRVAFDSLSLPRAMYGLGRAFLFLEFFYDAPRWLIAAKGLGLLVAVLWILWRIRPVCGRLTPAANSVLASGIAFITLQAGFGIYYFGSDTERWVFITPLVWLALAGYLSLLAAPQRRIVVAGMGMMFAINLSQGIWPAATDTSTKDRVLALERVLPAQALILTPGQDWVGYYHYFTSRSVETLALITLATRHRDDNTAFYEELGKRIKGARDLGKEILMIRILDPSENHRKSPWQELEAFGYSAERIRQWIARYEWVEQRLSDPQRTRVYRMRYGKAV